MIFKTLKLPLTLFQTNPQAISEAFERPSEVEMPFGLELQTTNHIHQAISIHRAL
jgi:hypothetical protein